MSSFEVRPYQLEILPHPNADAIELAKVGDYVSIVKKGDFKTGDMGIYIPEQALLPPDIIKEMGLEGRLSGSDKNRVKAIKLRGVVSQGLVYPAYPVLLAVYEKTGDLAEAMGIKKWEPPEASLPSQMRGKPIGVALNITVNYDIENIKKYNEEFQEGETVYITEKIHGTNVQFGYIPQRLSVPSLHFGAFTTTSKGLGGRGILLDHNDENVYARIANDRDLQLEAKLVCIKAEYKDIIGDEPIYLLGEIFGPGIQKGFSYGVGTGQVGFRAFDIAYGERGNTRYLDAITFRCACTDYGIPQVPLLYIGRYHKEDLKSIVTGKETVSGREVHLREGGVVRPFRERLTRSGQRLILKVISDDYLLLKDGATTEFQ
jgi:RNA ligase (TIGR02306 family)